MPETAEIKKRYLQFTLPVTLFGTDLNDSRNRKSYRDNLRLIKTFYDDPHQT